MLILKRVSFVINVHCSFSIEFNYELNNTYQSYLNLWANQTYEIGIL